MSKTTKPKSSLPSPLGSKIPKKEEEENNSNNNKKNDNKNENTTTRTTSQSNSSSSSSTTSSSNLNTRNLLEKKAWDASIAPGKQLFMTGFMMWMSGRSVNIFSIIITCMTTVNLLKAIFGVNNTFQRFEEERIPCGTYKALFILLNAIGLVMAAVKCHYMGLVPSAADWQPAIPPTPVETSVGGVFASS